MQLIEPGLWDKSYLGDSPPSLDTIKYKRIHWYIIFICEIYLELLHQYYSIPLYYKLDMITDFTNKTGIYICSPIIWLV